MFLIKNISEDRAFININMPGSQPLLQRERKVIVSCVCLDHFGLQSILGKKFLFLDTISIISSLYGICSTVTHVFDG